MFYKVIKMGDNIYADELRAAYFRQAQTLTDWFLNRIKTEYKDDVAIVVHENNLHAPGYEDSPFPSWFIPATERGKKAAITFIIAGKKHDFFPITWDDLPRYESAEDYDTMIFADSTVLYSRGEDDLRRFEESKRRLFENLKNDVHMRRVALKDYNWAVDVSKDCALATNLSTVMMDGCYVCDLLVHSVASLNNTYIPRSFTDQYKFLQSCEKKPEGFEELYLMINRSRNAAEIKEFCVHILDLMKRYLGLEEEQERKINADGLAIWYEEMIDDWNRIRGFAEYGQPRNVRGWANKLQYSIQIASKRYGVEEYPILEKFDEDDMNEFFKYADWVESDIRRILHENHARFNEFSSVDEFISAYERNEVRL